MQPASAAGSCSSLLLLTPAGGKMKLKWDKRQWLGGEWPFGSILMNKVIKKLCVGCVCKRSYITTWSERWRGAFRWHLHSPLKTPDAAMPTGQKRQSSSSAKWLPLICCHVLLKAKTSARSCTTLSLNTWYRVAQQQHHCCLAAI